MPENSTKTDLYATFALAGVNSITLNHDEMRVAAAVFDAVRSHGCTTLAGLASAVRAVNKMRADA